MKIIIISGFLGAGKTRFIQEMVKKTGLQFVIVENEFGELDLDGQLLQNTSEKEKSTVWELMEGCICCSLNVNFVHSILTIANTLSPEYLLIEPSGVALLSKILEQLKIINYEHIRLHAPILLVDSHNFMQSKKEHPEFFQDQLAFAGTLVLSKSESYSEEDFISIKNSLSLPKDVCFPTTHYSQWSRNDWLDLLNREIIIKNTEDRGQIKRIFRVIAQKEKTAFESISFNKHHFNNIDELNHTLLMLLSSYFGQINRVKGYCRLGKDWVKFDLVGREYVITGCDAMPDERIVIIGSQLEKRLIKQLFKHN